MPGLGINKKTEGGRAPRDVALILEQYRMCQDAGARSVNFYSLDNNENHLMLLLTEPLIDALRAGPFADKVPAYHPPAHGTPK